MYRLEIFYPDGPEPTEIRYVDHAAEAMTTISELHQEHGGCERIVAWLGVTRLFAVDCKGNRVGS